MSTQDYLQQFREMQKQNPGPIDYSLQFGQAKSGVQVLVTSIIHGDEVGSLPSILEVAKKFIDQKMSFDGQVIFALGNVEAARINRRFVLEDLNRLFVENLANTNEERNRAQQLLGLIRSSHLFLDLHQTIEPTTQPFYVVRMAKPSQELACCLDVAKMLILTEANAGVAKGFQTASSYAFHKKVPTVTVELSQKGYCKEAYLLGSKAIERLLSLAKDWSEKASWQNISAEAKRRTLETLQLSASEAFQDEWSYLKPGFANLTSVKKNEVIGYHPTSGQEVISPKDGWVIFPKYPDRMPDGRLTHVPLSHMYTLATKVEN